MVAKQMEVRANIKEYFDRAYSGETIIVSRKKSQNVVIISENEYNRLTQAVRVAAYAEAMKKTSEKRTAESDDLLEYNKRILSSMRSMKAQGDKNDGKAISSSLIDKVDYIIEGLVIQPEITSTSLGTILLEYYNSRKDHMRIEIGEGETGIVCTSVADNEADKESVEISAEAINRKVAGFYGCKMSTVFMK